MASGHETELKLAASPAMLLHLRAHPLLAGDDRALTLVTRYFDTEGCALRQAGATLRLRNGDGAAEQTFKLEAAGKGALGRGEWNASVTDDVPDPARFDSEPRDLLVQIVGTQPLQPLAVTRVERTARQVRFGTSVIEAAFDTGTITAQDRSAPICELELELVDGTTHDLLALAQELPLGPELQWSTVSKGQRGAALAFDLPSQAGRARHVALDANMDIAAGFQAIAWNCLAHLLGNYRQVIATGAPDAVHQSRVAIRRLRAAFSLFADVLGEEQLAVYRAEWKAVAAGLGPARDMHVLVERIEATAPDHAEDATVLLDRLRAKRAVATQDAQALLAGKAFQRLLVDFAHWLEQGADAKRKARQPLPDFAARQLTRRRRKLVAAGKLAALSDEALHELRIKGKKLRYAAEFFATLFPKDENGRRDFAKALGKLQDCLGGVHDLAVAQGHHETLFTDVEPIAAAGLSAQLGAFQDHGPDRKPMVRSASRALARVAAAPAWWKHAEEPAAD